VGPPECPGREKRGLVKTRALGEVGGGGKSEKNFQPKRCGIEPQQGGPEKRTRPPMGIKAEERPQKNPSNGVVTQGGKSALGVEGGKKKGSGKNKYRK